MNIPNVYKSFQIVQISSFYFKHHEIIFKREDALSHYQIICYGFYKNNISCF
jgi:hypothetical protein